MELSELEVATPRSRLEAGGIVGRQRANVDLSVSTADMAELEPLLQAWRDAGELTVDLEAQTIEHDGATISFEFDAFAAAGIDLQPLSTQPLLDAARLLYEDRTLKPSPEEIEMRRLERIYRAAATLDVTFVLGVEARDFSITGVVSGVQEGVEGEGRRVLLTTADWALRMDVPKEPKSKAAKVKRDGALIWHWLEPVRDQRDTGAPFGVPDPNAEVQGDLDWARRHALMRTHTALHVLCGVIWADFGVAVTGGNMEPGKGRLDFELDAMSAELGTRVERRINEEIERARDVLVDFVDRAEADRDPALIRTKANLVPAAIDPLRVIDIVGLDKQADGGTHVRATSEVGRVRVAKTESKGKAFKRMRIELVDA